LLSTSAPTLTPSPTSSGAPPRFATGFDFVFDTVTSSYTDAQVWIVRNGVAHPIPGGGYGLNNPVPSPDGRSLLVDRTPAEGSGGGGGGSGGQLAIISLTGKLLRTIPHTASCFPGGWTNTGAIVIACGQGTGTSTWHVLTIRPDGTGLHPIAPDDPGDPPSVSADGTMVAYGYNQQTWVVSSSGGQPKMVLPDSEGGAWSPDGKHLAVTGHDSEGSNVLDLVNADGSGHRKITDITTEGYATSETFSPDGKGLLLAGSADVPFAFSIAGIDGRSLQTVDPTFTGGDPQRLPV
jgi:WD40 repeat protein